MGDDSDFISRASVAFHGVGNGIGWCDEMGRRSCKFFPVIEFFCDYNPCATDRGEKWNGGQFFKTFPNATVMLLAIFFQQRIPE